MEKAVEAGAAQSHLSFCVPVSAQPSSTTQLVNQVLLCSLHPSQPKPLSRHYNSTQGCPTNITPTIWQYYNQPAVAESHTEKGANMVPIYAPVLCVETKLSTRAANGVRPLGGHGTRHVIGERVLLGRRIHGSVKAHKRQPNTRTAVQAV
jgi:hypothetical protein